MKKTTAATGLALITALVLTGCGNGDGSASPPAQEPDLDLAGHSYLSDTVMVDDEPHDLVTGSRIRLTFDDSRISANAGCNTMSGAAAWANGTLVLGGALASTEMGCKPDLMDQDSWLADVLGSEPTLDLSGDTLTLTSDTTVITLTDEEVAVPDASLTGTLWQLDTIIDGDAAGSVPAGVVANITFAEDGSLHANLGCNIGNGTYTDEGDVLQIGPLATTRKACEPAASDVETAMLKVLDGEVGYQIDGKQLTLEPTDGSSTSLVFGEQKISEG